MSHIGVEAASPGPPASTELDTEERRDQVMGGGAGVAAALLCAQSQARIGGRQPSQRHAAAFLRAHWGIPLAGELGEEPSLAGLALTA
jgi:hypothetical protein